MAFGICNWWVVSKATGEKVRYIGTGFSCCNPYLKARLVAKQMNKIAQADIFEAYDFWS